MEQLKGNAVVGQSGGPTVAINATLAGVIRGALNHGDVMPVLYGMHNGVEGLLKGDLVVLNDVCADEEKLRLLEQTPASALGSCRKKLPDPDRDDGTFARMIEVFKQYDIRYFFYIGGNDSMDTVAKLTAYLKKTDYEMVAVGLPKTVDNDLVMMDHSPGFGSAAKFVAVTMQEILRDCAVYKAPAVTVVETMGRDAGWLTAASVAGGYVTGIFPDYVYLPERPLDVKAVFRDVREAFKTHPNVVIVVSEGVKMANGTYINSGSKELTDAFGHRVLAGAGCELEKLIKKEFGCKTRSIELNITQRCAAHLASAQDIKESAEIGAFGVESAVIGRHGCMVALHRTTETPYAYRLTAQDVALVANKVREVPDMYINGDGNGLTPLFKDYILPLIQGEVPTVYENGVPRYVTF